MVDSSQSATDQPTRTRPTIDATELGHAQGRRDQRAPPGGQRREDTERDPGDHPSGDAVTVAGIAGAAIDAEERAAQGTRR